jgi:hypothetical protein
MTPLRRKAPEPAPVMVALYGGIFSVKGVRYTVRSGERLRSDHPLVKYRPALFAPDGLTDAEMSQAREAYSASKGRAA